MAKHFHVIVWIDHHVARVCPFNAEEAEMTIIRPDRPMRHIHHKANTIGSGHAAEDQRFYAEVAERLSYAGAVVITGPANSKHELLKHLEQFRPELRTRVVGVESLDHPTDGELVAYGREYFKAADRMLGQK